MCFHILTWFKSNIVLNINNLIIVFINVFKLADDMVLPVKKLLLQKVMQIHNDFHNLLNY